MQKRRCKQNKWFSLALVLVALLVIALVGCSVKTTGQETEIPEVRVTASQEYVIEEDAETEIVSEPETEAETGEDAGEEPESEPVAEELPEDSYFEIHFIDVGQADSALILCDDAAMLIDGGNRADSDLVYTYLKNHEISYLDYIVCTHAHEDHVGGLAGALNYATVGTAFCPVTEYDSTCFGNFVKYLELQEKEITVPAPGDTFELGSADCTILGPVHYDEDTDPNSTSIVIRIEYGNTSFLFTGDAEQDEEADILNLGYDLQSTVLKVGHHGSETSSSSAFLEAVSPQYAVISVGTDNSYGHPHESAMNRLNQCGAEIYRTDYMGDIICRSDGTTVTFETEKNVSPVAGSETEVETEDDTEEVAETVSYVLNLNTRKFHYPSCSSVEEMNEANRSDYTGTREDLIAQGYSPCGRCNP